MPWHTTEAVMRTNPPHDSRHRPVTWIMWRANRLADHVAKAAAKQQRVDPSMLQRLAGMRDMQLHVASLLGTVTYMANHCPTLLADGSTQLRRDSDGHRPARGQRQPAPAPAADNRPAAAERAAPPATGSSSSTRKARRRSQALQQQCQQGAQEAAAVARRLAQLQQLPPGGQPSAAERLQALAERVRARAATAP